MVQIEETTAVATAAIDHCNAFAQAMMDGDADALETLLAEDFTYTHKNARVEPLAELIPSIRGGRKNTRMEFEDMSVRSYPGLAIVNGTSHMAVGPADSLMEFDSHFTAVLADVEGSLKLVVYHSTGVPEE